jgi:hypothetical protein
LGLRPEGIHEQLLASAELRQAIVERIGSSTVALFALLNSPEGEVLKLAGTGTLFAKRNVRFILTATHVWERVLKTSERFGINLIENIDHSFWIDPKTVAAQSLPNPTWGEWGPDLTLLRIPSEHLGSIDARKLFYDPRIDGTAAFTLKDEHIRVWLLMGTPEARGHFQQSHATVEINGRFIPDAKYQERNGLDYYDLTVDTSIVGPSQSFGGVSGGGLWRVLLYYSPEGKINWVQSLEGVAFYQGDLQNGHRTIRCHGPKSILVVTKLV